MSNNILFDDSFSKKPFKNNNLSSFKFIEAHTLSPKSNAEYHTDGETEGKRHKETDISDQLDPTGDLRSPVLG